MLRHTSAPIRLIYKSCTEFASHSPWVPTSFLFLWLCSNLSLGPRIENDVPVGPGMRMMGCPLDPNYLPIAENGVPCTNDLFSTTETTLFEEDFGLYDDFEYPHIFDDDD